MVSGLRRWTAACAIALSLSGCCTMLGLTGGAIYASSKNNDPYVQQGDAPRTSVAKSMLVAGAIGVVLDFGLMALAIYESGGPGH